MSKSKTSSDNDFFFETFCTLFETVVHLFLGFFATGWQFMQRNKFGTLNKVDVKNYEYVSRFYQNKLLEKEA